MITTINYNVPKHNDNYKEIIYGLHLSPEEKSPNLLSYFLLVQNTYHYTFSRHTFMKLHFTFTFFTKTLFVPYDVINLVPKINI